MRVEQRATFTQTEASFKGGMLHGLVETALTRQSPSLWADLRDSDNHSPRYALRVPQDSALQWPAGYSFELGVILFSSVQHLWTDVLAAFSHGQPLGLGQARTLCTVQDVRIQRPGVNDLSLLQATGRAGKDLAHWQARPPQCTLAQQLRITLQAPCLISSEKRRLDNQQARRPYTLSSIVRSVQRRMQTLEPVLAQAYGFWTPEWRNDCQSLWPHQIASHSNVTPRNWRYASRNTPGHVPVLISAIEGDMHYDGAIPAPIVSLLRMGQWIGMGQKTSLGMGWYAVEMDLTNDTTQGE